MVILSIIEKWSHSTNTYNLHNIIINKMKDFYEELNNIKLNHLNKLKNYWYYHLENEQLYLYNLIINNKEINNCTEIKKVLKKLKIYKYKYIEFHISTKQNNNSNDIFNFKLNDKTYYLINFIIKDKDIYSICKNDKNNINKNDKNKINKNDKNKINKNDISKKDKKEKNDSMITKKIIFPKNQDWSNMIPASSVRNYILNDPLLDFLKEYNIHSLEDKPSKVANSTTRIKRKDDDFTEYIMKAGIQFEDELYKIISYKHQTRKVAEPIHAKSIDKFKETIKCMQDGVPIIYQGVLHNYHNKTYGLPDLIVRSDYINKLMGYQVISKEEEKIKSKKLNINYHYKIIDIKHSTIKLRYDGEHILNSDCIPVYKSQLYIYTLALNQVLGININKAFIWGKKYKINKIENNNFMNKLGVINYDNVDKEYILKTNKAIEWLRELRQEGNKWSLLPMPCRYELYPNMKNEKDGQWHTIKNDLNKRINEITNVWQCNVKRRKLAHDKKIFSWKNKLCNSEILGFDKKSESYNIVNGILDINRQEEDIIKPIKIIYDRENWDIIQNEIFEFYLDFETLNSNFGSIIKEGIISYDNNEYIFLIGLGYVKDGLWKFVKFLMNKKTKYEEQIMFDKFYAYIRYILKINNKKIAKFYHWSQAEVSSYNKFKIKNDIIIKENDFRNNFIFYDLYKVFIKEPILIKGALNFSLKTIAKTLYNHKLIESTWNTSSPCSNGLNAMILANNLYDKDADVNIEPVMKEIIYYNEIDCKVMYEIHKLMRKLNST